MNDDAAEKKESDAEDRHGKRHAEPAPDVTRQNLARLGLEGLGKPRALHRQRLSVHAALTQLLRPFHLASHWRGAPTFEGLSRANDDVRMTVRS